MAMSHIEKSQLRLLFEAGIDPITQEPVIKRKNFNNIKVGASAAALHAVAETLSALQQYNLYKVERVDQSNIEPQ